jgi:hypothetical protein
MRTKITVDAGYTAEHVDFGVTDAKGRTIGAMVHRSVRTFAEIKIVEVAAGEVAPDGTTKPWPRKIDADTGRENVCYSTQEPGAWFRFCPQATRGSASFGASQYDRYYRTEAEREEAVAAYLQAARARAAKTTR